MKKILIATTALVAAGMISTGAQAADKVKLELGGFSKWFVVGAWNNNSYERATRQSFNNVDVKGQSDITFSGSTKLDNGLDVGVFTAMRAGTNTGLSGGQSQGDSDNYIDRAYLYVASGYGKVIMGVLQNGTHLLHVQAPEAIGQWNDDGLLTNGAIIQKPGVATSTNANVTKNGTFGVLGINGNGVMSTSILPGQNGGKVEGITYVAPSFYGLTLGGSYIPNDNKNVRGAVNTRMAIHDIFGVGANYTNNFGDFGVKASFGWARGSIGRNWGGQGGLTSFQGQNINFFNAGLNFSYAGFTLGGSFRWNEHDVKKGGIAGANTATSVAGANIPGFSLNGHAWDAGLQYATGPWAASVSYFGSTMDGYSRTNYGKKEEVAFVQASAKYDLGPGVALQGLVGYGNYKASTTGSGVRDGARLDGDQNKGWTALTGVAVQF